MATVNSPESVYRELVEESDEDWLLSLVAFAIFEEQRIEWMRHIEETTGHLPTPQDISNWYAQQPPNNLIRAKADAEAALVAYAGAAADEALQAEQRAILESSVVEEIRLTRRFLPQFGTNVLAGLVSTMLVAAVLVVLYFVQATDVSPQSMIINGINSSVQEGQDGQKNGKSGSNQQESSVSGGQGSPEPKKQ